MRTNTIRCVFGQKGQGKSFRIKRMLDKLPRHAPVYVWDFNREYAGDSAQDAIRNAVAFRSWREFLGAASKQKGHIGRVAVQVERERFGDFVRFCLATGHAHVVLDELHMFCQPHHGADNRKALEDIFYVGRHAGINLYTGAWRPTEVPVYVRHAADEIHAFQTNEVNDLKWYAQSCGASFASKLPTLKKHVCLVHTRGPSTPLPSQPKD